MNHEIIMKLQFFSLGYGMLAMSDIRDVGCWICGVLATWDAGDTGYLDVGCLGYWMLGMCDVWDVVA